MLRNVLLALTVVLLVASCGKSDKAQLSAPAPKPQPGAQARIEIKQGLWIVEPADNTPVGYRPDVYGTISDTLVKQIWVVVHPPVPEYWVQPEARLRGDGLWACQPYIGSENTKGAVKFEVRAFANPKTPLEPGSKLATWPDAQYSSNTVTLVRQ